MPTTAIGGASIAALLLAAALATGLEGADSTRLPRGSEPARLDPADFTTTIDNPYWPMRPGMRWMYREIVPDGGRQRVVVTVTRRTRTIANGITARIVRDTVTENGELVEDTFDWYAQDQAGNVWYLGERTREYENGKVVSTAGSWEAGVAGAQPGVVMPAIPRVGLAYRQEHYAGEAEDEAAIVSVDEQVEVPFGRFARVLMTKDTTPLEPRVREYKFYARGVGPVLAISVSGGNGREELVRLTRGT
jgi:hypothetical protein